MSEETKNTAQEEETTDTPVTEETVENEPEVVENGEAETEEIPVEDGDEEASQDDKKDSETGKAKCEWADKIGRELILENNISPSFRKLLSALQIRIEAA